METRTRLYTNKLLELVDEGVIDAEYALTAALKYMSEDDVKDMCEANEFILKLILAMKNRMNFEILT